jgi:hypothetical protein
MGHSFAISAHPPPWRILSRFQAFQVSGGISFAISGSAGGSEAAVKAPREKWVRVRSFIIAILALYWKERL